MAFLKLFVLLLIALSVVFVSLFFYLRALQRDRLEASYSTDASALERKSFVNAQLQTYTTRLLPRLAVAVYGIPLAVLAIIIYVTNFT